MDGQSSLLPQDVLFGQLRQFRDPQPGIEQDQNDLPLASRVTRLDKTIPLVAGEGFACVLAWHLLPACCERRPVA
jgi:hypothetical protein